MIHGNHRLPENLEPSADFFHLPGGQELAPVWAPPPGGVGLCGGLVSAVALCGCSACAGVAVGVCWASDDGSVVVVVVEVEWLTNGDELTAAAARQVTRQVSLDVLTTLGVEVGVVAALGFGSALLLVLCVVLRAVAACCDGWAAMLGADLEGLGHSIHHLMVRR